MAAAVPVSSSCARSDRPRNAWAMFRPARLHSARRALQIATPSKTTDKRPSATVCPGRDTPAGQ